MLQQLLEILKYILPAIVVLIATTMIVNKFLVKEIERKQLAIFQQNSNLTLQMRLQAYERLAIFVERMHPNAMVGRYYTKESTAQDLQLAMVQSIRAEYEHNLSQQIYVSHEVWQTITSVKEQEITMINRVGASIPMGAPANEFVKALTEFVLTDDTELPTSIALESINREAKKAMFTP
ncbi:hypothetical protein EMGBS15_11290 [Filimonas sp.]|jgi:hypothetical protein|nr:hypothetical protein EMGBS15_11290 [Filimonas sp.]